MLVLACIRAVEPKTIMHAIQRDILRPKTRAVKPAVDDEIKAPRVIRDEISCCLSAERLYPSGVSGAGSPKTCLEVSNGASGEVTAMEHQP
jgi:hypothetical protein